MCEKRKKKRGTHSAGEKWERRWSAKKQEMHENRSGPCVRACIDFGLSGSESSYDARQHGRNEEVARDREGCVLEAENIKSA